MVMQYSDIRYKVIVYTIRHIVMQYIIIRPMVMQYDDIRPIGIQYNVIL